MRDGSADEEAGGAGAVYLLVSCVSALGGSWGWLGLRAKALRYRPKQWQRRNTGVSPLRFAPVEMTCFYSEGWVEMTCLPGVLNRL